MVLIAVFGVAPLVAVPLSGLAARTLLPARSTADSDILVRTAVPALSVSVSLFAALFADGRHVSFPRLGEYGKNPARAPGPGIPLASVVRPCSHTAPPVPAGRSSFLSDVHPSKENGHART
ncbi:hypothetical protein [Streptomyces enissocaesilis]|uniref:ABC transmembrane type-1 domain-containing protein n=1 Tax=Streptomyces enissocaesilis TaxID=332589 RepID=A0ABN3XNZ6_9ACTN